MGLPVLLLLAMNFSFSSNSCKELIPNNNLWHFAHVIMNQTSNDSEKQNAFRQACMMLDPNDSFSSDMNRYNNAGISQRIFLAIYMEIPDAFRNIGGTSEEQKYTAELMEIKKIPSAAERVQRTYELFLRYKKSYDHEYIKSKREGGEISRDLILTPGFTLKNGGVCRDFARLLNWSLKQVARSSSTSRDAEVFTSDWRAATGEEYGHMWVSVNLPLRHESGRIAGFRRIDLDPTNFTDGYVPLMPLAQNTPEVLRREYFQTCQEIISCIRNQRAKETQSLNPQLNNHNSGSR